MTPKPLVSGFIRFFFIFTVPLLLSLAAVRLVMSYQFLHIEYLRPGFPADYYGLTTEDRLDLANFAIDYLFNGEGIDFLGALRLPREKCWQLADEATDCAMFRAFELNHMQDVKRVTLLAFRLCLAIVAIAVLVWRVKQFRRAMIKGIYYGSLLTLAVLVTALTLAATVWDLAFDFFHEVLFAAGTWRFPFSDTLIRLYPEQLFVDAAIAIALICAFSAILLLFGTWQLGDD